LRCGLLTWTQSIHPPPLLCLRPMSPTPNLHPTPNINYTPTTPLRCTHSLLRVSPPYLRLLPLIVVPNLGTGVPLLCSPVLRGRSSPPLLSFNLAGLAPSLVVPRSPVFARPPRLEFVANFPCCLRFPVACCIVRAVGYRIPVWSFLFSPRDPYFFFPLLAIPLPRPF